MIVCYPGLGNETVSTHAIIINIVIIDITFLVSDIQPSIVLLKIKKNSNEITINTDNIYLV